MNTTPDRIKWACRRGMLELDLFLIPFFEHCYANLSDSDQRTFQELLEESDPLLFAYLMGHASPANTHWSPIIEQIRSFRLQGNQTSDL